MSIREAIKIASDLDISLNFKGFHGNASIEGEFRHVDEKIVIALANWNHIPEEVHDRLQELGVYTESSKRFVACNECAKLVRLERPLELDPDESWVKDAHIFENHEIHCGDCARENLPAVFKDVSGHPDRAITLNEVDYESNGYMNILGDDKYFSIRHDQEEVPDPKSILLNLNHSGIEDVVFAVIYSKGGELNFRCYSRCSSHAGSVIQKASYDSPTLFHDEANSHSYSENFTIGEAGDDLSVTKCDGLYILTVEEAGLVLNSSLRFNVREYMFQIQRIIDSLLDDSSVNDPAAHDLIWNSEDFRKAVFLNVGVNRESYISRMHLTTLIRRVTVASWVEHIDEYKERILKFYRKTLPALLK
jgi:hypothetical protein